MNLIDIIIIIAVGLFIVSRFSKFELPNSKSSKRKKSPSAKRRGQSKSAQIIDLDIPQKNKPAAKVKQTRVLKPTKEGVAGLKEVDPNFNEKEFLQGAVNAFGNYYIAWQSADEDKLGELLSPRLFNQVVTELEEQADDNKKPFVALPKNPSDVSVEIVDARISGRTAIVDVKYNAEMLTDFIGKTAKISKKKPKQIVQIWTWARPIESDDPSWHLEAVSLVS